MPSHPIVQAVSPYLTVKDASSAIDFYSRAFGASETLRLTDPADGRIGHCELELASGTLMISDEYPDFGAVSPPTLGGSPVKLHLLVDDVDAVFARAVELGATELRSVRDEFHGHRGGQLCDPFGHIWHLASKIEDVSPAEMQERWDRSAAG